MFARQSTSCIASTSRAALATSPRRIRPPAPSLTRCPILPFILPQNSTVPPGHNFPAHALIKNASFNSNPFSAPDRPGKPTGPPRNENIPHAVVRVVDRERNALGPPEPLEDVLARLKLKKEYVQLLSADPPVVKIFTYEEEKKMEKQRKESMKAARQHNRGEKEIQLSWGAQASDLQHKIDKIKEALGDRRRVSVVISAKPKTPAPSDERRAEIERRMYDVTADLAIESQPPQRGRRHSILYFKPKAAQASGETQ